MMAKRYAPCVRKYAKSSRFSANTLQKVYNRGIGLKTNPRSVRHDTLEGRMCQHPSVIQHQHGRVQESSHS